jgi:hypothetical protein
MYLEETMFLRYITLRLFCSYNGTRNVTLLVKCFVLLRLYFSNYVYVRSVQYDYFLWLLDVLFSRLFLRCFLSLILIIIIIIVISTTNTTFLCRISRNPGVMNLV